MRDRARVTSRYEPSWSRALLVGLAGLAALAYAAWTGARFADLLVHGEGVDAVSIRAVEGLRRGHWTTTVALDGGECVLEAVHAEPGETVRVLRDRTDPTRCVADAFFPTLYVPFSCTVLGLLCLAVLASDVRKLSR